MNHRTLGGVDSVEGCLGVGANGFLVSTDQEWRSALETLCAEPDLRTRMGKAGRQKVEASYSTRVTAPLLAAILKQAPYAKGTKS
jgi:glycosyltransferase involved in cell wall biosynthesis